MIYQTFEVLGSEKECVTILMGKLFLIVINSIIELNDVDHIYFQDVISYFHKKYKEDSYRQLTGARSSGGEKTMRHGCFSKDWNQVNKRLETLRKEQKYKPTLKNRCSISNKWGHSSQQCLTKPCTIDGEWNHVVSQCRAKAGMTRRNQSKSGSREVYGVSFD